MNTIFRYFENKVGLLFLAIMCMVMVVARAFGWETGEGTPLVVFGMALTEGNYLRDIVRFEDDSPGKLSREVVTVASGQTLTMGAVIGKITKSCPATGTADAGNTGAGTMASVTAGLKAKLGTYMIECLTYVASPLSATFQVTDPDGNLLPEATLAAYVSDQLNFDIGDASPAITVADKWTVLISAGSGSVKEVAAQHDAVDGTSVAYGIIAEDVDASGGAVDSVAIVKDAVIIAANLVWPTTSPAFSADDKTAALAELAAKGIVARDEA